MRWKVIFGFAILAIIAASVGIGVAEIHLRLKSPSSTKDNPILKDSIAKYNPLLEEYVGSLFEISGKAQDEFQNLATASPLLTSYAMALFTTVRCSSPPPTDALSEAVGGVEAFNTEAGMRVFAVVGVVTSMTHDSTEAETRFCEAAKRFVQAGENYVSKHRQ